MKQALQQINNLKKMGLIRDYAIGGGIAVTYYIEPIFTYDLDVFVIVEDSGTIVTMPGIVDTHGQSPWHSDGFELCSTPFGRIRIPPRA